MKYAIILPDGAADEPLGVLRGQTPLAAAATPNMDWIAANGRVGTVVTVPEGFKPGTDVATLSLFGYAPNRCYPGRAPIEAAAQRLNVNPDQLIFRCNFVTIQDGRMKDFTAGHISQPEADRLVTDLNRALFAEGSKFHSGVSYRNLMLLNDATNLLVIRKSITCTPPHDIPNRSVEDHWPQGEGALRVRAVMDKAAELLKEHEVNQHRKRRGLNLATHIWLWGQGKPANLESFTVRFGISGAMITGVDIIRGLAVLMGMDVIEVAGATGFVDTDYAAKGRAAVAAIDQYDLVIVHIEAPDEAGHLGNAKLKVESLEQIDEHVVGPVLQRLRRESHWRVLIAPDHPTPVSTTVHSATPPPFCMAGSGIKPSDRYSFSERDALNGKRIEPGTKLIDEFLKNKL